MSGASRRRPSAALIVAVIAVVVALTGTAVAGPDAQFARKLVIDGGSIKLHSIPASALKNHSITALQLDAAKLGTIPHARLADLATRATNATTAVNATNAINATNASTAANAGQLGGAPASSYLLGSKLLRWNFHMNKGDAPHPFGPFGPVTFTGTCAADGAKTKAALGVTTSQSGTFVTTSPDSLPGTGTTINAGDPPYTIVMQDTTTANDGNSTGLALFSPDGSLAVFSTAQTIGVAINTTGADCRFFGFLINDA